MDEKQNDPVAPADEGSGETGVGSAASAPEAAALAADQAAKDRRAQIDRIRGDAANAIRPGPAAT